MTNWFDLTSLIGGILLAFSLIALGTFAVRHGQKAKGTLLLLAGICTAILMFYSLTTPNP